MNTFFLNGIPPLGECSGSRSKGSVSKEKHDDAVLFERTFEMYSDAVLCRRDTPALWYVYYDMNGGSNDWGSESDIQGLVKQVLQSAICTVGLAAKIKCFNELSIFDLRPDIWIVCTGGIPIGVVEVKKPGDDDDDDDYALQNPYVQGQIFDYMLRLQSFFGLEHVFGILSSYSKWRVCWLPGSERAAMATSTISQSAAEEQEMEIQTVVPERVLHGSKLFAWDDENLPRLLCTTILKMYHAPRSEVSLIDKKRPYIIMDKSQWWWSKIGVEDESNLYHSVLPSANKFTLLVDLREGADGRVWRACTDSGLGCCIKFPMRTKQGELVSEVDQLKQIQEEATNWRKAYGDKSARVTTLCGRPALIMRYLRPLEPEDGTLSSENVSPVKTAIEKFASKGLKHDDLAIRHIGVLSPPKKRRMQGAEPDVEVVLFDLGRVSETTDPVVAVADMMTQLNLM